MRWRVLALAAQSAFICGLLAVSGSLVAQSVADIAAAGRLSKLGAVRISLQLNSSQVWDSDLTTESKALEIMRSSFADGTAFAIRQGDQGSPAPTAQLIGYGNIGAALGIDIIRTASPYALIGATEDSVKIGERVSIADREATVASRLAPGVGYFDSRTGQFMSLDHAVLLVDDFAAALPSLDESELYPTLSTMMLLDQRRVSSLVASLAGGQYQPIPIAIDSAANRYSASLLGNWLFVAIFGLALALAAIGSATGIHSLISGRQADWVVHRAVGATSASITARLAVFVLASWLVPALVVGGLASTLIGGGLYSGTVMSAILAGGVPVVVAICAWGCHKIRSLDESRGSREGTW